MNPRSDREQDREEGDVLVELGGRGTSIETLRKASLPRRFLPWLALVMILAGALAKGEERQTISLPPPQTEGGKPLLDALRQRRTVREFKPDKLPLPVLGNLLWAAFGVNRPDTGGRTAPSAMNSQEVDIYVALSGGVYLYEPKAHQLRLVLSGDLRGKTSGQSFATNAPRPATPQGLCAFAPLRPCVKTLAES